jgi:hypothetical protein
MFLSCIVIQVLQSPDRDTNHNEELRNIHQVSILVQYVLVQVLSGTTGVFLNARNISHSALEVPHSAEIGLAPPKVNLVA